MKLLKKLALLGLMVMVLGGCTKSSVSTAPEDMDPAKMNTEEDETLPRDQNFLVEDDTEEASLYDWDQVRDETNEFFMDANTYPLTSSMTFTADESAKSVELDWVLKNEATEDDAMTYAVEMVKNFNDIVAIQTTDVANSSEDSFGGLWDSFALTVKVTKEDGTTLLDKSYAAGEKIDLVQEEVSVEDGPTDSGEDDSPKKEIN